MLRVHRLFNQKKGQPVDERFAALQYFLSSG